MNKTHDANTNRRQFLTTALGASAFIATDAYAQTTTNAKPKVKTNATKEFLDALNPLRHESAGYFNRGEGAAYFSVEATTPQGDIVRALLDLPESYVPTEKLTSQALLQEMKKLPEGLGRSGLELSFRLNGNPVTERTMLDEGLDGVVDVYNSAPKKDAVMTTLRTSDLSAEQRSYVQGQFDNALGVVTAYLRKELSDVVAGPK